MALALFGVGGGTGGLQILGVSSAAAAFGFRALRDEYDKFITPSALPTCRIRFNDGSSTEVDFTWDSDAEELFNGDDDPDQYLTDLSATRGFVVKMYDQSGNGRDLIQNTAALQPEMAGGGFIAGTLPINNPNDRYCMGFVDSSNAQRLSTASAFMFPALCAMHVVGVSQAVPTSGNHGWMGQSGESGVAGPILYHQSTPRLYVESTSAGADFDARTASTWNTLLGSLSGHWDGTNIQALISSASAGALLTPVAVAYAAASMKLNLGAIRSTGTSPLCDAGAPSGAFISEAIFQNTAPTYARTQAFWNNQASFFGYSVQTLP